MDVPESIDVIMNVMPPIVLWNMIVSVVVASWCGQVFAMMVVLLVRVNGALNDQIYQDEILQHHVVPLINVTGGIFQHFIQKKHKHKKKQTKTKNKNKNKNVHALQ